MIAALPISANPPITTNVNNSIVNTSIVNNTILQSTPFHYMECFSRENKKRIVIADYSHWLFFVKYIFNFTFNVRSLSWILGYTDTFIHQMIPQA